MRPAPLAPAPPASGAVTAAGLVADEVARTTRLVQTLRTTVAEAGTVGDRACHLLLMPLLKCGPLRVGALAALVHADASTVSRHVAELLRLGLVRREADPVDGRASLLVVTDTGRQACGTMRERRDQFYAALLSSWADRDVRSLTRLLARCNDDLAAALDGLTDRITAERASPPAAATPTDPRPEALPA